MYHLHSICLLLVGAGHSLMSWKGRYKGTVTGKSLIYSIKS